MTEEYKRYLVSPQWRATRERAFAYHGRFCAVCGATRRLQVHHLTYERLGHELMSDFRILCKGCHKQGRYTASEIDRDRHSQVWVNALVGLSKCVWWLFLLPFRLGYRLLRLCLRRKRPLGS
jgi:5-methylcytosine-specific restriction endonuclease McrA